MSELSFNGKIVNSWVTEKLWKVNQDLAEVVAEKINKSGILDTLNSMAPSEVEKFLTETTRNVILNSDASDNEKLELIKECGVKEPSKLNWEKMVKDGDIVPGRGLTDDERIKLADKYNFNSIQQFNEALSGARQEWAEKEMKKVKPRIAAQREYLYYLTLGDDARQDEMKKKYKKDKDLMDFFKKADEELSGPRGWVAALARNMDAFGTGGSVSNAYANDVRNATGGEHEGNIYGSFLDYPRQWAATGVNSAISMGAGFPAIKAGEAIAKAVKSPLLKPIAANMLNAGAQGAAEAAREVTAGEEVDPLKIGAVAGSQATLPAFFDFVGPHISNVPVLGRLFSRIRKNSMNDPLAMKKQELADEASELATILKHPEVNADATRVRANQIDPTLNDNLLRDKKWAEDLEKEITEQYKRYSEAVKKVKSAQKRVSRASTKIESGDFSEKTMNRLVEHKNAVTEYTEARRVALEELNTLKEELDLARRSMGNEGSKMQKILQTRMDEINHTLGMTDDEILAHRLNTPSDAIQNLPASERELYPLIESNLSVPKTHNPTKLEEGVDILGTVSNNIARDTYTANKHPSYVMSKEDRWEDGFITEDELNSDEYYDWFMKRHGIAPEVSE